LSKLNRFKAMLAPILFGAGIKGKITESWFYGVPVITTPFGAEGLFLESAAESVKL
jgi:O-antigen biosynthesis protein